MGTVRLLAALRRCAPGGVRVLLVSSAEVYGAVPEAEQPISESRALCPASPYAASKAAAEMAALQAGAEGRIAVVIARSFNHTGPGQDLRFALPGFARQLAEIRAGRGDAVLRVGNLDVWRDFLDVRDVVNAYLRLAERGVNQRAYNVCSGEAVRLGTLVERLVEYSGTGARVEVDAERFRPVDIPLLRGDSTRLRALGWKPRIPLDETLHDLLASEVPA
jgi:GDP-4-dehydro-6-deoxy-D-mannose reductase